MALLPDTISTRRLLSVTGATAPLPRAKVCALVPADPAKRMFPAPSEAESAKLLTLRVAVEAAVNETVPVKVLAVLLRFCVWLPAPSRLMLIEPTPVTAPLIVALLLLVAKVRFAPEFRVIPPLVVAPPVRPRLKKCLKADAEIVWGV